MLGHQLRFLRKGNDLPVALDAPLVSNLGSATEALDEVFRWNDAANARSSGRHIEMNQIADEPEGTRPVDKRNNSAQLHCDTSSLAKTRQLGRLTQFIAPARLVPSLSTDRAQ